MALRITSIVDVTDEAHRARPLPAPRRRGDEPTFDIDSMLPPLELLTGKPYAPSVAVDQWLATGAGGYTVEQLTAAFDIVKPVPYWKDRIDVRFPASIVGGGDINELIELIKLAVPWFCGGPPPTVTVDAAITVSVQHAGYWHWIGS